MGLVIPLWMWLPVVMWVLWRWERKTRLQERRRNQWGQITYHETARPWVEPQQLFIEEYAKPEGRHMGGLLADMRSLILVAAFGLVSAFWFAWEPSPVVTQDTGAANISVPVAPAAVQPVYPAGGPPGMIYDAEHNSWHFPAAAVPTSPHHP